MDFHWSGLDFFVAFYYDRAIYRHLHFLSLPALLSRVCLVLLYLSLRALSALGMSQ